MCGIAGGTGIPDDERRRVVTSQLATLRRRGPDAWGFLPGGGATVGQTRLSIIDVQGGDPPITDESGAVGVALNGEIYNYKELSASLRDAGHRFTSACDTEVIAHLAEDLEPQDLAARLHGMFAFAIWDARRGRLVLGRDRLGKKPLYYWTDGTELVFGSELKAVLADPRTPRELEEEAIADYFTYGYAISPRTFFKGIVSLPPAHVLIRDDRGIRLARYWDVPDVTQTGLLSGTTRELATEARRLLEVAVHDRLVADVPLGAFLSGGVDSSAVVGLMAQQISEPVRTFCIGFDEPAYDERKWARLVSAHFNTEHTEEVVSPNASALLDDILDATDQPFADSSAVPTLLLSQLTRRSVTVALSGDGGDELFAGYERFAAALAIGRASRLPDPILHAVGSASRLLRAGDQRSPRARAARMLGELASGLPDGYLNWVRLFDTRQANQLLDGRAVSAVRAYDGVWAATEGQPTLSRLLDLNRRTYLLDDLLVKVDRTSMFHSLEVRSPFLDHRLVEFAVSVPPAQHLRGLTLKRLLKDAVADLLPSEVVHRRKMGFGVPLDDWFRGPLRSELHARLMSGTPRLSTYVDLNAVRQLVEQHDAGAAAHGQRLWALLMLERFLEREGW